MKKRVLVIDDIGIILDLVEIMLQMEGYDVVTAIDASTALAQIEETKPDLIVLDVMMPKMSGYDFIEKMRQRYISIPIILLTVKEHTLEELKQLGVAGYLRKPFHQQELLSLLSEILSKREIDNCL